MKIVHFTNPNLVKVLINIYSERTKYENRNFVGSGGIRTHASEETGALNQRLRPLGHATWTQI